MTTRERWIVYPLLFLTLGIAMRDKIVPPARLQVGGIDAGQIRCNTLQAHQGVAADEIRCGQLQAVEEIGAPHLKCVELEAVGRSGRRTVLLGTDAKTEGGLIKTFSRSGVPLVGLEPSDAGGVVRADAVVPWERNAKGDGPAPGKPNMPSDPSPPTD
jgi:hypothetical protein